MKQLVLIAIAVLWAVPAAAQREVDASRIALGLSGNTLTFLTGSGSPEGVTAAPVNSQYYDYATGHRYRKNSGSGNTGWVLEAGTVTSVALTFPTGLSGSGCTITTSGTCAVSLTSGYMIPGGGGTTGTFLRRNTTPEWSTLVLPNAATQYRIPFATATNVWGESSSLTFDTSMLTAPGVTASGAASILSADAAMVRQRRAYQTRYGSEWFVGYDGATWLTAFDTTGNTFMPLILRGSTVRTLGPVRFGGTATADGAIVAGGNVGTSNYVSQTTGWRVDSTGALDVRFLYTDELRAKIFTAVLEQVLAGVHTVSKSVSLLSHPFTCPSAGGSATLSVEDLPGAANMSVFESGDWVVIREFSRASGSLTIGDCAGQVTSASTAPDGYQTWTFTRGIGSNGGTVTGGTVLGEGGAAIDFGVSGNGVYRVTAVDGAYGVNSPYAAVETWTVSPTSSNFTRRATFGNLKGVTGVTGEYGFLAGTYAASNGQYVRFSNSAAEIHGLSLKLWNASTEVMRLDPTALSFAMGTSVPTSYTSGAGFWQGLHAGVYKWRIGDPAGDQYIDWNGTQLTVSGNIVVTGTSIDASSVNGVSGATIVAGAALANLGFDADGNPSLPDTVTTSGAGNYIGSDYMGFFDGSVWKTFIQSNGNFYLGGTSGKLQWNGTTLAIDGTVTAGAGAIGGWTIGASSLTDTAGVVGMSSAVTGGDDIRFWAGDATPSSAEFRVTESGALVASSATITGSVTSTSGTIGGWTLGSTSLTSGSGGTTVGVDSGGTNPAFYAGSATPGSAPFRVTNAGALTATNATITGVITATSGSFTGNGAGLVAINGGNIDAGSVNTTQLAADAVTAEKINVTTLSSIVSDTGALTVQDSLTVSTSGVIKSGATAFDSGTGYWLDYNGGSPRFRIGQTGSGDQIAWDGSELYIKSSSVEINENGITINGGSDVDNVNAYKFTTGAWIGSDDGFLYINADGSFTVEASEYKLLMDDTEDTDYPVVMGGSFNLRYKTNGLNASGGCTIVGDVTAQRGIVTDVTCNTVAETEFAAMKRELADLRSLVTELLGRGHGSNPVLLSGRR